MQCSQYLFYLYSHYKSIGHVWRYIKTNPSPHPKKSVAPRPRFSLVYEFKKWFAISFSGAELVTVLFLYHVIKLGMGRNTYTYVLYIIKTGLRPYFNYYLNNYHATVMRQLHLNLVICWFEMYTSSGSERSSDNWLPVTHHLQGL